MIVVTVIMISSGMFFMSMQPALRDRLVTNAYNTTLMTMRRAREAAIAERRTYVVTFDNVAVPNTITMTQAATGLVIATESLPTDIFSGWNRAYPLLWPPLQITSEPEVPSQRKPPEDLSRRH